VVEKEVGRLMEAIFYFISLGVICCVSTAAVFSKAFDDNFGQRLGLGLICIGSAVRMTELFGVIPNDTNARFLLTYGLCIYSLSSAYKFWQKSK
jgi:hypothetical protein